VPSGFAGRLARLWPAWGIVAIAGAATAAAALATLWEAEADARRWFAFAAQEVEVKVLDRLAAHEMVLRAAAGLLDAGGDITREQWRSFVERLRVAERLPGIQGIGFARSLGSDELAEAQAAVRAEGFPEFRVWPEGERARHGPIVFLEPFEGRNLRAFGYDLYSDPVRHEAMSRACDRNEAALSRKVTLVQETDTDVQAGTALFVPVYRRGAPAETVEERRRALLGWAYSPYRMQDLMRGILGGWSQGGGRGLRLQVFDGAAPAAEALLYDSAPGAVEPPETSLLRQDRTVAFAGSAWMLRFLPLDGSLVERGRAWVVLAEGVLGSGLLFALALVLLRTRERAQELAMRLTRDLRESEQRLTLVLQGTNDGTWDWDIPSGRVAFNERWATMLGYELRELDPHVRTWERMVHPDDMPGVTARLQAHLRGETPFYECEHRLRTRSGEWKWVLDRGQVVARDAEGKPLRAAGTHTDVSDRRLAEERTREALQVNEKLVGELREALQKVKALSGLLPICMYCKKIRDDKGYWEQIEGYLSTHTDALFSHGMCPSCFQEHRQEWDEE